MWFALKPKLSGDFISISGVPGLFLDHLVDAYIVDEHGLRQDGIIDTFCTTPVAAERHVDQEVKAFIEGPGCGTFPFVDEFEHLQNFHMSWGK